ncbi:MAG: protein-methionine-sulfoxide reductase catalytic subunit MsrP [Hyphomicrobiales bacterium]|nr:protein-methionine-sulfoxide reductase catalytic subunit MsrP [Hyphomicrobiales bacterium]MDE2115989.1 protein-methionine-sulfoxide reductase catalytic subunit MsrP [Hyphomicrobiales bacterium]
MLIRSRKSWEIPEREATPEAFFLNRRDILRGLGAGAVASLAATQVLAAAEADPTASLYPAKRNDAFKLDRPLTPESTNAHYNNFYEYGTDKTISAAAQQLEPHPWQITIDGLVEKPMKLDVDDLIKAMPLEERLYRHRCVEAWSMTIPWTGFSLAKLIAFAKPKPEAKYIQMETFLDPKMAPGQEMPFYPWPYIEGLTMAEATNELAFMVTGAYGKPLLKQFGAPMRLAVPWKYGFKSIKSITKISFVTQQPNNFWQQIASNEYGFWANVNPAVPHPRWSQASERILGTMERKPTLLFNGYEDQVASLYKGMEKLPLYR